MFRRASGKGEAGDRKQETVVMSRNIRRKLPLLFCLLLPAYRLLLSVSCLPQYGLRFTTLLPIIRVYPKVKIPERYGHAIY